MDYLVILGSMKKVSREGIKCRVVLATDSDRIHELSLRYENKLDELGVLDKCRLVHLYEESIKAQGVYLGEVDVEQLNSLLDVVRNFKVYGDFMMQGNMVKLSNKGAVNLIFIWKDELKRSVKTTITKRLNSLNDWGRSTYKKEYINGQGKKICLVDQGFIGNEVSKDLKSAMNMFKILETLSKNFRYVF